MPPRTGNETKGWNHGTRWKHLLQDEGIARWYRNVAKGSEATADNYLRILGAFLQASGIGAKELIGMHRKRREDLIEDYLDGLSAAGKAGSYVYTVKRAIASWLVRNGLRIERQINVARARERPRLRTQHIPSQEELRRVLNAGNARERTAVALMAFSGLRPRVLGDYRGTDGLTLGDFPEVRIQGGEVSFDQIPTLLKVDERFSKNRRAYFTFLGEEGCQYLGALLRERIEGGQDLGSRSAIITPTRPLKDGSSKPFIRAGNIAEAMRNPMRRAGLSEPPYILRSYFAHGLMVAEGRGLVSRDYSQFWMGHEGDIEAVYRLRKQIPQDTVEEMRAAYGRALEFLETTHLGPREDPTLKMLSLLLQAAGYAPEDVEAMDLANKTEEEVVDIIRQTRGSMAADGNGGVARQRVISLQELDQALAGGWAFRAPLPDGRVVVERSHRPI